ncbi:MAG: TIGR02270 family protein [Burkholderiaceae bacterium]|nr:TIGR02270 family protein [Burkholderiaceae bacterium]
MTRRIGAVRSPAFSFTAIERFDELLDAHVDGLREARAPMQGANQNDLSGTDFDGAIADALASTEDGDLSVLGRRAAALLRTGDGVDLLATLLMFTRTPEQLERHLASLDQASPAVACAVLGACRGIDEPRAASGFLAGGTTDRRLVGARLGLALAWASGNSSDAMDIARTAASNVQTPARVAAVLLGDRADALADLERDCSEQAPGVDERALGVWLAASGRDSGIRLVETIAARGESKRPLFRAVSLLGDSFYIAWLVKQMADDKLARLAGESFSMITGLDLAYLDLDRKPPEDFESGPNDDPDDENVDMDPDEGLPWPDSEKIAAWWKENESRFPAGQRFFMGQPPSMAHCLQVLKTGYQRQRVAAAIWRCILKPGTPLFPTDAPAWRQKRWLASLDE